MEVTIVGLELTELTCDISGESAEILKHTFLHNLLLEKIVLIPNEGFKFHITKIESEITSNKVLSQSIIKQVKSNDKENNFDDYYCGYIIKDCKTNNYIGPDSDRYRVARRCDAARFTKNESVQYIKSGIFCKDGGPFIIEDAR